MEPWTLDELLAALPYQGYSPRMAPTKEQLRSFYDLYGPSARDAYSFVKEPYLYETELNGIIRCLTPDNIRVAVPYGDPDRMTTEQPHRVFLAQPLPQEDSLASLPEGETPLRENRHLLASVSVISTHVMDLVWEVHNGHLRDVLIRCLEKALQDPSPKSIVTAGQVFERVAHPVLSGGGKFQLFNMTAKAYSFAHWKRSATQQEIDLSDRTPQLFRDVEHLKELDSRKHSQPIASDNRAFDSFICDDTVMTLFQSTLSHIHGVNERGLRDMQGVRNINMRLKDARLRYVVVIPMQHEITVTMSLRFYGAFMQEEKSFEMWATVVNVELSVSSATQGDQGISGYVGAGTATCYVGAISRHGQKVSVGTLG